ncbi:tripartite ATP-independent periplasmictransporter, DctQ component [Sinorhizobium americanum CCGM7]|nr:tripartite ATP-independent periplasmictransporter, DctQ component [Sinorhizobium americanum CCGM7]
MFGGAVHRDLRPAIEEQGPVRRTVREGREGNTLQLALRLIAVIDGLSRRIGIIAIYLVLFCSLVSAFNAIFRYSTDSLLWLERNYGGLHIFGGMLDLYRNNSNTLSEMQWYMFAAIVLLGGPWALKMNEHVRVDLFYGWVSERTRTWIDLLGGIFFLLPMCLLMIYFTWPWFVQSWVTNEGSLNAGGLPRWPVKLLIPVGFGLVALQGVAEVIKCILALTTNYVREFAYEKPLQ